MKADGCVGPTAGHHRLLDRCVIGWASIVRIVLMLTIAFLAKGKVFLELHVARTWSTLGRALRVESTAIRGCTDHCKSGPQEYHSKVLPYQSVPWSNYVR